MMSLVRKICVRSTVFVALGLSSVASFSAEARTDASPKKPFFPAPIAAMIAEGKGVKFQDKFDAPGGLQGFVLSAATGERRIYYVTPDGKHAILGILFDQNLENVTAVHQRTYMNVLEFLSTSRVDPAKTAGTALDLAMRSPSAFSEGKGADLYVVFDSECAPCARLHRDTRSHLDRIRIHWIPVALVNEKSAKWMAVFLQAREKSAVLSAMFAGQDPPSGIVSSSLEDAQASAREIIKSSGASTLPLSLFLDVTNAQKTVAGPLTQNQIEGISKISEVGEKRSAVQNR